LALRTTKLRIADEHPAAEGHFPGNPIIPGAILLREIVAAVSGTSQESVGDVSGCLEIRSAKFHHPVRPGDTLTVSWTGHTGGEVRFSCSVDGSDRPAVTGMLRLSPP